MYDQFFPAKNATKASDDENTCLWDAVCIRDPDDTSNRTGHCPSASYIFNPIYNPHPPVPTSDSTDDKDEANLSSACPFISVDDPVCCNSDDLEITAVNFQSLDAVFNSDCPVCATNLKVMWCLYACSPV